jgi:hypothetical protein
MNINLLGTNIGALKNNGTVQQAIAINWSPKLRGSGLTQTQGWQKRQENPEIRSKTRFSG